MSVSLNTVCVMLRYSDSANQQCLRAAALFSDEQLDRPFDMGRGSLRKTLLHIQAGENVWLQRWQGRTETPWPDEDVKISIVTLSESLDRTVAERDSFLKERSDADLERAVAYRDSKGGLFSATLGDMMVQMVIHSTHHRAQAVNMLRRLGASPPELDYMTQVRRPA
ncbi:MAG: DinB family protein [Phycisphaerae bacterium]